jgi:hypothetical protein
MLIIIRFHEHCLALVINMLHHTILIIIRFLFFAKLGNDSHQRWQVSIIRLLFSSKWRVSMRQDWKNIKKNPQFVYYLQARKKLDKEERARAKLERQLKRKQRRDDFLLKQKAKGKE